MVLPLRLVTLAVGLALVVVVLGGWTRLNDAGLGCPDWPGCYGTWVLPGDHAELAMEHPEATIDLRKGWIEMIHRYAAGTLGLLILGLAAIGYRHRKRPGYPRVLSFGLLLLVMVQGIFGMWTVTLQLLPLVVTVHLLGGLATLMLLVLLRQRLVRLTTESVETRPHPWVKGMLAALFLQLALGGWTSTHYAGWACSDWLYCQRDQAVAYDFAAGFTPVLRIGPNYEGGLLPAEARAAIQVTHRLGAIMLFWVSMGATFVLWPVRRLRRALVGCWCLLLIQAGLGIANVIWLLPLGLAVAHHIGAVALLLMFLHLNAGARIAIREVHHGYLVTR
ncbi:COX15/CtaA family protein [Marinobacterium marinum]|uniref:COX15/CtaA family protein n=1 Tax=Marinobacterium marinum TaxID=2756129 RepID=A0A7W2AB56_9GAMM|nr:COX15/CtaA family protein [Marinobacterium marinum]MBA4501074.1 COX15/CtaA family protein [Marinobacterium marinum]